MERQRHASAALTITAISPFHDFHPFVVPSSASRHAGARRMEGGEGCREGQPLLSCLASSANTRNHAQATAERNKHHEGSAADCCRCYVAPPSCECGVDAGWRCCSVARCLDVDSHPRSDRYQHTSRCACDQD
jgi:hypothetical protein